VKYVVCVITVVYVYDDHGHYHAFVKGTLL